MSKSINKVILIGHLGQKPETKYTTKGTAYTRFSIATNSAYKDADNKTVEKTDWHNIIAWTKLAEICTKYLDKGSLIYCEGRLQTTSYEKNSIKSYYTDVVMEKMVMLNSKKSEDISSEPDYSSESDNIPDDEALPF